MLASMMPLGLPQENCTLLLSCLSPALWTGMPAVLDRHLASSGICLGEEKIELENRITF